MKGVFFLKNALRRQAAKYDTVIVRAGDKHSAHDIMELADVWTALYNRTLALLEAKQLATWAYVQPVLVAISNAVLLKHGGRIGLCRDRVGRLPGRVDGFPPLLPGIAPPESPRRARTVLPYRCRHGGEPLFVCLREDR